jgi:hypothetical protein
MAKPTPAKQYSQNVFINCPFDKEYSSLFDAIVFAVHDMGFRPRCALEARNAGQFRLEKILEIISQCKYSIHDLSRTELDPENRLPRFNMPFELGLDLGCKKFGSAAHTPMQDCLACRGFCRLKGIRLYPDCDRH